MILPPTKRQVMLVKLMLCQLLVSGNSFWITTTQATKASHAYLKKFLLLNCIDIDLNTHLTILNKLHLSNGNTIWCQWDDYKVAQLSKFSTYHLGCRRSSFKFATATCHCTIQENMIGPAICFLSPIMEHSYHLVVLKSRAESRHGHCVFGKCSTQSGCCS